MESLQMFCLILEENCKINRNKNYNKKEILKIIIMIYIQINHNVKETIN